MPEAGDKINYQIPAVTLAGKPLLYFSGWLQHISLYPIPETDEALDQELAPYRSGKGTLKFPLAQPMPYDLIGRLAALFVEQREAGGPTDLPVRRRAHRGSAGDLPDVTS